MMGAIAMYNKLKLIIMLFKKWIAWRIRQLIYPYEFQYAWHRSAYTTAKKEYEKRKADLDIQFQREQRERDKEAAEFKKVQAQKVAKVAIDIARQTTDALFQIGAENRQAEEDAALAKLNQQKDRELSNKELTEQQREAINKKYAQKEAAIKLAAWYADQKAKEQQALINGALAITNILATAPVLTWPLAIGAAAATTALQIAVIESAKPPAFAKGTKNAPEGMAWVGEEGPELTYLPQGAKVITHPESMKIMEKYGIPSIADLPEINISKTSNGNMSIDYGKLASTFAGELKKNPTVIFNYDKSGAHLYTIEAGKRVERLNRRYKTG